VKPGLHFTKISFDEDVLELKIEVSDGTSVFANQVYVGYSQLTDAISQLDTFKDHVHGGLLDMRFGEFGPEFGGGAFHARFHFAKPGKLYITCKQQSEFRDFARKNVASEAMLFLETEPGLLDDFLEHLKALDAKKREDAHLEAI
jgi:hypothetical protein